MKKNPKHHPKKYPVIHEEAGFEARKLLCPLCGYDYTHLLDIVEIRFSDTYEGHPFVRGNVIVNHGWCENGCRFSIFHGQHKGWTFVWGEERTQIYAADVDFNEPGVDLFEEEE